MCWWLLFDVRCSLFVVCWSFFADCCEYVVVSRVLMLAAWCGLIVVRGLLLPDASLFSLFC